MPSMKRLALRRVVRAVRVAQRPVRGRPLAAPAVALLVVEAVSAAARRPRAHGRAW